jgi:hypothetical protein
MFDIASPPTPQATDVATEATKSETLRFGMRNPPPVRSVSTAMRRNALNDRFQVALKSQLRNANTSQFINEVACRNRMKVRKPLAEMGVPFVPS